MTQNPIPTAPVQPAWQQRFTLMLPKIQRLAHRAFRSCTADLKDELVAQVIADTFIAYRRLVECGRENDAHPTVLAAYSIKRIGGGLQVGSPRNRYDLTSRYCQLRSQVQVQSLQRSNCDPRDWSEMFVACRRASPAELAASRIDMRHWLSTLSFRDRAVALMLATGEETRRVAQRFGLTSGRISQLRRELELSWFAIHGLGPDGQECGAATA